MNSLEADHNLSEELEKAKLMLEKILSSVRSIDEYLKPIEQELQEQEFMSRGAFVRRNPNFIVCLPGSSSTEKKKYIQIQEILEKIESNPSIVWIDNYTESNYTCARIAGLLETQFVKHSTRRIVIINLKLSQMIQPFESMPTLMIGKRYILDDEQSLSKVVFNLKQFGLQIYYDDSEFGGGNLTSSLVNTLQLPTGSIIVEFTLSHSAVKKPSCVYAILDSFSSIWK